MRRDESQDPDALRRGAMLRPDGADDHAERAHHAQTLRNQLFGRFIRRDGSIRKRIPLVPCGLQRRMQLRRRPGEDRPRTGTDTRKVLRHGADAAQDRTRVARDRGGQHPAGEGVERPAAGKNGGEILRRFSIAP